MGINDFMTIKTCWDTTGQPVIYVIIISWSFGLGISCSCCKCDLDTRWQGFRLVRPVWEIKAKDVILWSAHLWCLHLHSRLFRNGVLTVYRLILVVLVRDRLPFIYCICASKWETWSHDVSCPHWSHALIFCLMDKQIFMVCSWKFYPSNVLSANSMYSSHLIASYSNHFC